MSAFKHCPLIWMFCNKTSNNQINRTHKRTLRLVYEMQDANLEDLLLKDNSWNVHESNIPYYPVFKPMGVKADF